MISRKTKLLIVTFVNISIVMLAVPMATAVVTQYTITACYTSGWPTINGVFEAGEWAAAGKPTAVELFNIADQSESITIELMAMYDAESILYIGASVPDTTAEGLDERLEFFFETNPTTALADFSNESDLKIVADNDCKIIWVQNNHSQDMYTTGNGFVCDSDANNGGNDDSLGKCFADGVTNDFELQFPLNAMDSPGKDPALSVNDTIKMLVYYVESNSGKTYSQYKEINNEADFCLLTVGCISLTTNLKLVPLIISLLASTAIGTLIRKKKRHS